MKKILTAALSLLAVCTMLFCFAGCGANPKKEEAIKVFNETSTAFDAVATTINENADSLDDQLIGVFQEMSALLTQYKGILESSDELSDEKYDEMINWFGTVKDWTKSASTAIEDALNGDDALDGGISDDIDAPEK